MADPTRILIADDHAMFRAGIKALLESEPLLEVVGEVSSGDEAVDQVRILKPHVVLMDLSMPGSNGLEATRRIAALNLDTKVLVLTAHAEEEYLVPVVEAGASGYYDQDERRHGPDRSGQGGGPWVGLPTPKSGHAPPEAIQGVGRGRRSRPTQPQFPRAGGSRAHGRGVQFA